MARLTWKQLLVVTILAGFTLFVSHRFLWPSVFLADAAKGCFGSNGWMNCSLPEHLQNVDQHDKDLVEHIRRNWIVAPSKNNLSISRPYRTHFSQFGQSEFVDEVLRNKTNGFFIECGAAGGEKISNTLFFERERNWTGLLVEANPMSFETLLSKNRQAYALNACLSPKSSPVRVKFLVAHAMGGITDFLTQTPRDNFLEGFRDVQCFPLWSTLAAIGVDKVDYLSLDTEGSEVEILQTLPFDEVDIEIVGVETSIKDDPEATRRKRERVDMFFRDLPFEKLESPHKIDSFYRKKR